MKRCTKVELLEEAQRLKSWSFNEYLEYSSDIASRLNQSLSSRATKRIQNWIDIDSSSCRFLGVDDDFTDVSLSVAERMRAVVPRRRVIFFATETPSYRRECHINNRGHVGLEIGALALLYSVVCQLIDALPDAAAAAATPTTTADGDSSDETADEQDGPVRVCMRHSTGEYPASLLGHLKAIDGTQATYPAALSAVYQLLELLGTGGGLLVMIDRVDLLQVDEASSTILSDLLGLLAGTTAGGVTTGRLRLWLTYGARRSCCSGQGQGGPQRRASEYSIYQSNGIAKAKRFKLRPGFFGRRCAIRTSLRFDEAGVGNNYDAGKGEEYHLQVQHHRKESVGELLSPTSVRSDVSRLARIHLPFEPEGAEMPRGGRHSR
jgi:hypothetical protein